MYFAESSGITGVVGRVSATGCANGDIMWLLDEPNQPYEGEIFLCILHISMISAYNSMSKKSISIMFQIASSYFVFDTIMAKVKSVQLNLLHFRRDLKWISRNFLLGSKKACPGREVATKCHLSLTTTRALR